MIEYNTTEVVFKSPVVFEEQETMAKKKAEPKDDKRTTFGISLPESLMNELRELAKKEDRSMSQMCAIILREGIRGWKDARTD